MGDRLRGGSGEDVTGEVERIWSVGGVALEVVRPAGVHAERCSSDARPSACAPFALEEDIESQVSPTVNVVTLPNASMNSLWACPAAAIATWLPARASAATAAR